MRSQIAATKEAIEERISHPANTKRARNNPQVVPGSLSRLVRDRLARPQVAIIVLGRDKRDQERAALGRIEIQELRGTIERYLAELPQPLVHGISPKDRESSRHTPSPRFLTPNMAR